MPTKIRDLSHELNLAMAEQNGPLPDKPKAEPPREPPVERAINAALLGLQTLES
jgi:hypothetical protein